MPDKTQQPPELELPPYEHVPETDLEREQSAGETLKNASAPAPAEEQSSAMAAVPPAPLAVPPAIMEEKSQMRRDIERILEEDLGDIYLTLNQKQRSQFRIEGEKAAAKIELILQQAKVHLMTLIKLIRAWLLLLPGVNRFFLEQEAKIKAEKLLILKTADE